MIEGRFGQVINAMMTRRLHQVLVTEDRALSYLTGHKANSMERVGSILIKDNGEIHSFMNVLFRFPELEGIQSHHYMDGENPYELIAKYLEPGDIGIDDTWESRHTISLLKTRSDIKPEHGSWVINEARKIKDSTEIKLLKKCSNVNGMAIEYGIYSLNKDISEKKLADSIEDFFVKSGGINVGQYQVVCYGANAADPHHEPDDTLVKPGDAVLIDLVGLIDGYWSDMTRTVFYKEVSEENRNIYEIVRKAQIAGIKAVKPGIPMKEIDAVTRGVIEAAGYGEYFITRTGHGVGLSIHEEPMCSPDSEEICREGMCFSIEPGIYIPGKTGVRIEDLVIVTGDGCKVLTHYPKDLQIIK